MHMYEYLAGACTPAALRLAPPGCGASDEGALGRNWIVYNKPHNKPHAHAGFLMGLGLQGHLLALANTDLDQARSLSAEEPSLTGLAVKLVSLGLNAGVVVSLFREAAKVHGDHQGLLSLG